MSIKLPYNGDALIFNDHGSGSNRRLIKHVLPRVWWDEGKGINITVAGVRADNTIKVIVTMREGYKTPQEWAQLTADEALSGKFYTMQNEDRMIKGTPESQSTFSDTIAVDQHFGTQYSHPIMEVVPQLLPGGKVHHFEVRCK